MTEMGRLTKWLTVLAGPAIVAAVCLERNYGADGTAQLWSTKKVMDKCYVGNEALMRTVRRQIERAPPDWKGAEKDLTEVIRLMSMLAGQKPLRGSERAWDGLVADYVQNAQALKQNISEQKINAARASLRKLAATCDECHDNHGIQ